MTDVNLSDISANKDALTACPSEIVHEELKEAILECTIAEVVRALNDVLCRGNNEDVDKTESGTHRSSLASHTHTQRPHTVDLTPITCSRPKSSLHSKPRTEKSHLPQLLPLEYINVHYSPTQIDRSSFNLLQRSSSIIEKTTGEPPKKYGSCEHEKEAAQHSNDMLEAEQDDTEVVDCDSRSGGGMLQQVVLWPANFRPTTATRLIHTAHSVLRNKPYRRRPLTSTALERRKPPPSTAASQQSKAQEVSERLLGPITLETKCQHYDFVIPNSLACYKWENELARNIINVFSNKARSEIKGDTPQDDANQTPPSLIVNNSLFSDNSAFHRNNFIPGEEEDFQRISISREATAVEIAKTLKRESIHKAKKSGKRDVQNGTFRLKMIWFSGTGKIRANWEAINELSVLEEHEQFMRYASIVESSIASWNNRTLHRDEHSELKQQLWRQLIITCNCFATSLVQKRKYSKAMGEQIVLLFHNCLTAVM